MLKKLKTILKQKKKGNTLSETLITLVIVGVVFTISIGTIVADHNRNQIIVRLKKSYSAINQSFQQAYAKYGSPNTWEIEDGLSEYGSYEYVENYIKPFMVLMRDCKNSTNGSCDFIFKELNSVEKSLNSTWARFFLNDGTFVAVQSFSRPKYKVAYFYIDVNGKKRLNVVARDIFLFEYWIQNDDHPEYIGKLLPFGHQYTRDELISENNDNNCNSKKSGNYCSALIMKDSWQIIDGYPWAQARYIVQ